MGVAGLCLDLSQSQVPLLILSQPGNTNWIVGDERRLAQARLAEDAGEADQDTENDT
jgi:hypothetical protein